MASYWCSWRKLILYTPHKKIVNVAQLSPSIGCRVWLFLGAMLHKYPVFEIVFFYGLTGGIACGLARFMFTSRPKSAADFAVGSFAIITMGYWMQCRYEYSKMKMEMERTKYLLQQHTMLEGTTVEKESNSDPGNVPVEV